MENNYLKYRKRRDKNYIAVKQIAYYTRRKK